jgi:hypothetical protein
MKQLTVLVPNQTGVAAAVASALAARGVNIEALDIEGVEERGIIVLTVDKYDEALRALRDHGYRAITQDTLLVRLEDHPGALASIAVRLKDAGLDLRSLHIVRRENGITLASLVTSDLDRAAEILKDVLVVEPPPS